MSNASDTARTPRRRAGDRRAETSGSLVSMESRAAVSDAVSDATPLRSTRHNPSFVTHLIAIAERCPQTRVLRRASPEVAMAAYRAADVNGHVAPAGGTTRQNI